MLTSIEVSFRIDRDASEVIIEATCKLSGKTGVEMEALTAASVAALTIYDMCKAVDRGMQINSIGLIEKRGGKSGHKLCTSKVCRRFAALLKSDKQAKLGVDDLAKSMHSANQGNWTIQTMIFEPQTLKLHICLTKPPTSAHKLTTIELSTLEHAYTKL